MSLAAFNLPCNLSFLSPVIVGSNPADYNMWNAPRTCSDMSLPDKRDKQNPDVNLQKYVLYSQVSIVDPLMLTDISEVVFSGVSSSFSVVFQVNIVDPLKLTQEFGNILADPIIATNVSATLHLHNGL